MIVSREDRRNTIYQHILDFWFSELKPQQWWQKSEVLDSEIRQRFGDLHEQARSGELFTWRNTALESLAEILILDQFSRNIYRDKPESFASDAMALTLAQTAIDKGFDKELTQTQCAFLYMPFMHSESSLIQNESIKLYERLGIDNNLDFALKHKVIIDRFGRYPHRNAILGRPSSEEEIEFLKQPGSGF